MAGDDAQPGPWPADEVPPEIAGARETVIEAFEATAALYGVKRSCGRIYGLLYFADEPLSLDELAEQSGYAKSTVSTVASTLERYYLVHRRSRPGAGKRVFYEAQRDWWYALEQLFAREGAREVATMRRAIETAETALDKHDGQLPPGERERFEELSAFYDGVETLVEVAERHSIEELLAAVAALEDESA